MRMVQRDLIAKLSVPDLLKRETNSAADMPDNQQKAKENKSSTLLCKKQKK